MSKESALAHFNEYENIARQNGVKVIRSIILARISEKEIREAIETGEGALNEIALSRWDNLALAYKREIYDRARKRWSLCMGVCTLKHVAKYYIGNAPRPEGASEKSPFELSTDELRAELES